MLNPQSAIPLYFQLQEHLRIEIITGRLREGDRIPPERELARQHGISRMTARQALQELEQEGYLTRQSGRGTFVTAPGNAVRISSQGFSSDMEERGMRPGSVILACGVEPAPPIVAFELHLAQGAPVVRLERVRLSNGEPIAHQVAYLSSQRFPGLTDLMGENQSLYRILQERYGVARKRGGKHTVESISADRRQADLLKLSAGAPLLRVAGTALDEGGLPVENGWTVLRTDRFKLTVELV